MVSRRVLRLKRLRPGIWPSRGGQSVLCSVLDLDSQPHQVTAVRPQLPLPPMHCPLAAHRHRRGAFCKRLGAGAGASMPPLACPVDVVRCIACLSLSVHCCLCLQTERNVVCSLFSGRLFTGGVCDERHTASPGPKDDGSHGRHLRLPPLFHLFICPGCSK